MQHSEAAQTYASFFINAFFRIFACYELSFAINFCPLRYVNQLFFKKLPLKFDPAAGSKPEVQSVETDKTTLRNCTGPGGLQNQNLLIAEKRREMKISQRSNMELAIVKIVSNC